MMMEASAETRSLSFPQPILGAMIGTVTLVSVCSALQQRPQEHGSLSFLDTTLNSTLSLPSHHL